VTAIQNPPGMGDAELRKVLQNRYNVLLQGGQGALTGKIFRIGHMGIASWADLLVTFAGLERILAKAGRLPRAGVGLSAIVERMPAA
jgi:serine---pyruvate transaminase